MSSQNSPAVNCGSTCNCNPIVKVLKCCTRWGHVDNFPLLFIPNKFPNEKQQQLSCLYDVRNNAIYDHTGLQGDYNRRCCGSCFGWLAFTDTNLALSFTNPFLAQTLKFPSISSKNYLKESYIDSYLNQDDNLEHGDDSEDVDNDDQRGCGIHKAILSKDPTLFPDDYIVIAIHDDFLRFSCIKPDSQNWVEIEDKGLRPFSDVIIFNGSIYAVSFYGGLGALDITHNEDNSVDNQTKLQVLIPNDMEDYADISYLVESSQSQLLHVRRFIKHFDDGKYKTWKFDVFMLGKEEEDSTKMKWVEVKSLGEDALFLGDNGSISILAGSNIQNCEANSIYYTDNYYRNGYGNTRSFDMGIYNLSDGSFRAHYVMPQHTVLPSSDQNDAVSPPIWIQPTSRGLFNLRI